MNEAEAKQQQQKEKKKRKLFPKIISFSRNNSKPPKKKKNTVLLPQKENKFHRPCGTLISVRCRLLSGLRVMDEIHG
jgi:hypothetical protein